MHYEHHEIKINLEWLDYKDTDSRFLMVLMEMVYR